MPLYKSDGIVLRMRDLGEADKLLTLYTRDYGKVRAVAKGGRRPRNRLVGATEIFTYGSFLFFRGKNLDTISQGEIKAPFQKIREDLEKMAYGTYLMELTDELMPERERHEDIFILILTTLYMLQELNDHEMVARTFELRLLSLLGYHPNLHTCVNCGRKDWQEELRFSPTLGGILCPACLGKDRFALPVNLLTLNVMRYLLTQDLRRLSTGQIPAVVRTELEMVLRRFLAHHLDKELKSLTFLEEIKNMGK